MRMLAAVLAWLHVALLLVATGDPAAAREQSRDPLMRIADNVLLVPDPRARSVTGWLIVLAGCADEADGGCRGIAHYLEHLLFINRDNEHRSKVAFFADGSGNGWTSHRATGYFQRFPSRRATDAENIDKLLAHFAGLLTEVRAEGPQADRERNVVLQEYQQNTGRNPFARFGVDLNRALLPDDPLGQRVIGSPETIAAFTTEAARAFHARWYSRTNAIIVLHGPIDADVVRSAAERHIAPLPDRAVPAHAWKAPRTYAPERQLLRSSGNDVRQVGVTLERVATFDERPEERARNDAALAVLSSYLASELRGSPHDTLMERDALVTQARMSAGKLRDGTLRLSFSATPAAGIEPERVLAAARDYLEQLWRTGLTSDTVERLKARITLDRNLMAEQPARYAQALTGWLGAHGTIEEWRDRQRQHEAVTPDNIARMLAFLTSTYREVSGIMTPSGPVPASGPSRPGQPVPLPSFGDPQSVERP